MARSVRPLIVTPSLDAGTPNSDASASSIAARPAPPLDSKVPSISKRKTCMEGLYILDWRFWILDWEAGPAWPELRQHFFQIRNRKSKIQNALRNSFAFRLAWGRMPAPFAIL